ncbi:MAG: glycosidase, partial [Planctomycetota bacterium]
MLVERFTENPLITPSDIVPSRDDYEVVGAFNAGATVFNDEILLLLRVAERPKDKADDEELAPILDPHTGRINPLRIKHGDPDLELLDSRVFNYKNKMYLTSISHLRLARSRDGIHFDIDPTPAVFPQTEYETFGL